MTRINRGYLKYMVLENGHWWPEYHQGPTVECLKDRGGSPE